MISMTFRKLFFQLFFASFFLLPMIPLDNAYAAPPAISSFSPTGWTNSGVIYISGTNFDPGASAFLVSASASTTIDLIAYNNGSYNTSSTNYGLMPPPGTKTGAYFVGIRNLNGDTALSKSTFTVSMKIGSFTPTQWSNGGNITIYGTNFSPGATAFLRSTATGTTVNLSPYNNGSSNTGTSNLAFMPPGGTKSGTYWVGVKNPDGDIALSTTTFSVLVSISSFTPGTWSSGGILNIYGSNFDPAASAFFLDAATNVKIDLLPYNGGAENSPTTYYALVPGGTKTGNYVVGIKNPNGDIGLSKATFAASMAIGSFTPDQWTNGGTISISGTDFDPGATAFLVSTATGSTVNLTPYNGGLYNSGTSNLALLPPTGTRTGSYWVGVKNPNGDTAVSKSAFTVTMTIASFSPSLWTNAGVLSISGTDFDPGATAFLVSTATGSTVSLTPYNNGSNNTGTSNLALMPPAGVPIGTYYVGVKNPDGDMAISTSTFSVSIRISSFSPSKGNEGTAISIYGSNFDLSSSSYLRNAKTTISLLPFNQAYWYSGYTAGTIPPGAIPGTYYVVVRNGSGNEAVSVNTFVVNITILSFSPTGAYNTSDTLLTVNGPLFMSGSAVSLQNSDRTIPLLTPSGYTNTGTILYATVPAGTPTGYYSVVVTNPDGTSGVSKGTYHVDGAPLVNSIDPPSGWNQISTQVYISGQNFKSGAKVSFQNASNIILLSNVTVSATTTSLSGTVPAGIPAGVYDVIVTNPDGLSGTLSHGYAAVEMIVESVNPNCGRSGDLVTLFGTAFGSSVGTSSVSFNGLTSLVKTWTDTQVQVYVPAGASSGPVTVVRGGIATSGVTFTVSDGCFTSAVDYDIVALQVPEDFDDGETLNLALSVINMNGASFPSNTDPGYLYNISGSVNGVQVFTASGTGHDPYDTSGPQVATTLNIPFTVPVLTGDDDCIEFTATVIDGDPDTDTLRIAGGEDGHDETRICKCRNKFKFLSPGESDTYAIGSVIPIRFSLTEKATGSYVENATARVYLSKVTDHYVSVSEAEPANTLMPDSGNIFAYDSANKTYEFNFSSAGLTAGTWRIRIDLGDGKPRRLLIRLQ